MPKYLYTGHLDQVYPEILVSDGDEAPRVLVACPGGVREFESPPTDGRWVEIPDEPAKPAVPVKPLLAKE